MTIQGARDELLNLMECKDLPFYFVPILKKVAETIEMEFATACDIDAIPSAEPCEDAISRQAVLDVLNIYKVNLTVIDIIRGLPITTVAIPSAEPKAGHWIEKDGFDGDTYYDCSECGESFYLIDGTPTDNLYNYCPTCGAKMVEPQKVRDKE